MMAKTKAFTLNRKQYEKVRKMDHHAMSCWAEEVYKNGYQAGKDASAGPTAEEVLTAVGGIKGIGSKRLRDVEDAIRALFFGKTETKTEKNTLCKLKNAKNGLFYEHGVAKTEKAIAFFHGFFVCVQHLFPSGERGYQHDQRRLGQMKIGDQAVKNFEAVSRIDEDICPSASGFEDAVFAGRRFERPAAGGSDTDHAATGRFRAVDFLCL